MIAFGLLEREADVRVLSKILDDVRAGGGTVAVIEGETGAGKSALLEAAREQSRNRGLRTLTARGSELEQAFSFGVARQLTDGTSTASDRIDALAAPTPEVWPEGSTVIQGLFKVLARLTEQQALLISVDDVQWADGPSLRFLAYVAARAHELPLALVCALNTTDADWSDPALVSLRASATEVVTPRPLGVSAVDELIRASLGAQTRPGLAEMCTRVTGGNPFYLHELLQTLASSAAERNPAAIEDLVPPRVLRSVMLRLGRLGSDAVSLGRAVAVLGDGAPLHVAAQLAGVDLTAAESAADALANAGMLSAGEPLRFVHPMLASAVAFDMGHFERGRMHRRAAELLRAGGAPVERIAAHLLRVPAADDPQVADVLEQAAARSLQLGDPGAAARLLNRALDEPPCDDARPRVLLAAAKAEALAGSVRALPRLEEALAALPDGELRVEAIVELASLLRHSGQFRRAADLARRGRAELTERHPRHAELRAIELTSAAMVPELYAGVLEAIATLRARAVGGDPPIDPRLRATLIGILGITEPPEQVRELARAAIAVDPLIADSHGISIGWVASALIMVDELEIAEQWLDAALTTAQQRGAVLAAGVAALNRATVHYHRGRLDLAVADAERALDVHRHGWVTSPWSAPILARAHVARGDLAAARAAVAIGQRAADDAPDRSLLLVARAELELAAGEAQAALDDARDAFHVHGAPFGIDQPRMLSWRTVAARAAQHLGRQEEADELISAELAVLRKIGPARQLGAALTVAGVVRGGLDGLALLAEANQVLATSPGRLQRAESLLEFGVALRRSGDADAARDPLYAALELGAETGAEPISRRAREELAALGLRPRRAARRGVAALTPSERRIAELAAAGRSTPEISAQLHVSRNTVETHLSHVYRKLGVAGRARLREIFTDTAGSA